MRRRDVLRTAGLAALPLASQTARAGSTPESPRSANTHPGPYRPYGTLSLRGATDAVVGGDGTTVYIAVTDGFAVVDVSDPAEPTLLAERRGVLAERENGPLSQIQDVKVDGDTLLVVGPAHGGGGDVLRGAALYDVSNPKNPTRTGFHETDFPIHNCFLADGIAYLTLNTSEATALVLVDVSGDASTEVSRWSITDHESAWKDVSPFVRTMHDVSVHGDVAYLAHWDAGTWLLDVSDPANPTVLSQVGGLDPAELTDAGSAAGYQLPGNSHYATVNDDATVLGVNAEAWDVPSDDDTAGGPGGIDLYDVADPTEPQELAHIDAPPTPDPTLSGVWTTAHNFDFHGDHLYTSWYQGGVKIHDVSDPTDPQELAWWRKPDETSFWTAQHASGCFVGSSREDPSADGGSGAGAALYTFPDHPGVQENPPSLTTTTTTTTTRTTTTTTVSTSTTTAETSTRTGTTATRTPGLGGLSAIAALGAAGLATWRERREKHERRE